MTWSRAIAIAGSVVGTLASCRMRIVRGQCEPPPRLRDNGALALTAQTAYALSPEIPPKLPALARRSNEAEALSCRAPFCFGSRVVLPHVISETAIVVAVS